MTRRQFCTAIWVIAIIGTGISVSNGMLGLAASLAVIGVSLGVPLMRAATEHSK